MSAVSSRVDRFTMIVATGNLRNPAVQRYLHDLSSDLGEHIASITSALSLFIEVGKSLHFKWASSTGLLTILFQASLRFDSRSRMLRKTC
jgi:hypothetical protein